MFYSLCLVAGSFLVDRLTSTIISHIKQARNHSDFSRYFRILQLRERAALPFLPTSTSPLPSEFPEMEQERTLSLEECGLSATATPAEMIACLQARKAAKEAAKSANPAAKWVGGAEEIRLSADLVPLGKYEVYQHDPLFKRVLANRIGRNATLNPFVECVEVLEGTPLRFEGFQNGKALPNFLTLPMGTTESLRKTAEAGFRCVDVSALDIHIQSHVGQGSPVTAVIGLMDARWGDNWQRSMLASGEFDLGEGKPRLFTLPLVNLSVGDLVDDFDQCPLYLSISYNGLTPSWKGSTVMTVGEIRFGEFYKVTFSPYTRMKDSFDKILSERDSSRIVAGLHSLKTAELDYTEELLEVNKDLTIWTRPKKATPTLINARSATVAPDFCRSSSSIKNMRRRAPPRNSVDQWVRQQAAQQHSTSDCCDSDATGHMINVAQGRASYDDCGAKVLIQGLAEPVPVIQMSLRKENLPLLTNSFIKEVVVSSDITALHEGTGMFAYSLKTLLTGGGRLVAQRLSQIGAGKITVRADIELTIPTQTIGLFKAVYDMGNSIKGTTSLHSLSHLPGPVIDGVNEAKMSILMTPPVMGQYASFHSQVNMGQLFVGCLLKPESGTQNKLTVRVKFYVHSLDSWFESAIGNSFCFSSLNFSIVPGSMYIGDPIISKGLDVTSMPGTQWRAPILPNRGIWRSKVWYPNCSSSFLENYRMWRGRCYFRYYIVAPPLSRGTFSILALPPGDYDTKKVDMDIAFGKESGITPFTIADVDLTNNRHGFLEVDFTSWKGYFPAGCSANSYKDISGCPWICVVQNSNLTSLNKEFNKFHIYVELVEIQDCQLDGPSLIPITRIEVPDFTKATYASGNAGICDGDWIYAGILSKWPASSTWASFPVTPALQIFPIGYKNAEFNLSNSTPNPLVHRAQSSFMWQGGMGYKFLLNQAKPLIGAYSALALGNYPHGFLKYADAPNPMRGNQTIFGTDSATEYSCDLFVPANPVYNFMFSGVAAKTSQREYSFNGWVFLKLPPWEKDLTCTFLIRVGQDFRFSGLRPPSRVTTTIDQPESMVYS
ncbi:TPA_exp: polyprotein [Trillium govanianum cheravirus]|uniref:Polyprotein n=1 Tax=Trillium govanianum cheravirus TaxID=2765861 RepID=A0A8D9PH45_9SECO|nr:TPA_exp: polyprotein [Trillium govanianum cheravirus]